MIASSILAMASLYFGTLLSYSMPWRDNPSWFVSTTFKAPPPPIFIFGSKVCIREDFLPIGRPSVSFLGDYRIEECLRSASVIGYISFGDTNGLWFASDLFREESSTMKMKNINDFVYDKKLT
jgi:hypothetical protein